MSKPQKSALKSKLLILLVSLVFLFFIIQIGISLAFTDTFEITNVEISNKSSTVTVNSFSFEKDIIKNDVTFHKIGDSITYKIKIKNNDDSSYTIKSIADDLKNESVSYVFDNYEGVEINSKEEITFEITAKYMQEASISSRNQDFSANISFTLEDKEGNIVNKKIPVNNISNPKTGDNIETYITIFAISFIMLIILSGKHKAKHSGKRYKLFSLLILGALTIPTISKAATEYSLALTFETRVSLKDKLIISYTVDNNNYEIVTSYENKIDGLNTPEKEGYTFDGWKKEDGTNFNPEMPVTDDAKITAKFTPITYTISYDLKEGDFEEGKNNPTTYTIETSDIELNNPTKKGYIFTGWTGTELQDKTDNVTIAKGSLGNREYIANWIPINYTITYEGLTAEEEQSLNNPTVYNIETKSTKLKNPQNRKDSYNEVTEKFVGWAENETVSTNITIPAELENKVYKALWVTAGPNIYTITYNLNGGTVETANRTSYTRFDTPFTLTNPTKQGYIFTGWTGTNLTSKTENVTIEKDSTGNRDYTANWEVINYSITYEGLTDAEKIALNNPTTYNIESNNITLKNPSDEKDNDGDITRKFIGWKENQNTIKDVTIKKGTIGDKTYEAIWQTIDPTIYNITYNLNNGILTEENPTTFTKLTDTFMLHNPSKLGYTFTGWTGSNGTTPETNVQVVKGTRENLTYTANWLEINYSIEYTLNGGNVESTNPTSYTINSNDITLNNPIRKGYTFDGWTGTNLDGKTQNVTILNNSTGNKSYTANWIANNYTIVFDSNSGTGSMGNQEMTYDVSSNLNTNVFARLGFTFIQWNTQPDGSGTNYTDGQSVSNLVPSGELKLYAQWKLNDNTVAISNGKTYSSLQSAINDVPTDNTQTTITLLTNIKENVVIEKNKNIIFDFQNFTIKNSINDALITNKGTITISNGIIETTSTEAGAINNNSSGTFSMNGGQIKVTASNAKQAIYNERKFNYIRINLLNFNFYTKSYSSKHF